MEAVVGSSLHQLLEQFRASENSNSLVAESVDLIGLEEKAVFQRFVEWSQEWVILEAKDVIISRPLLMLEVNEANADLLTASLMVRFSSIDVYDASYFSWQTPLSSNTWPNLQMLARQFDVDLCHDSTESGTTLIGSASWLNAIAEKCILGRVAAMRRKKQCRYLNQSLMLFLRQVEDLCPFSREEPCAPEARVGGALLTARYLSECVFYVAGADTGRSAPLAEVFAAAHHTNCLHELLSAFEHL